MSDLATLTQQALDEVAASTTLAALGEVRVRWLGKKGLLTEQLKSLGALPAAERPAAGAKINDAKQVVQAAIEAAEAKLVAAEVEAQLAAGRIDVTATGRGEARGGVHPVTRARLRIESIFRHSGFEIATGPEIEDDFHNFEALNIPADHPARAMHDTFYFPDGRLLRTHTSPVQIRELRKGRLPLAMIMPGVQKPHCRPWQRENASCIGCKPAWPRPSMVSTWPPSACAASTLQDLIARPSR